MKYVSIDLETTGLDHDTCQILEFGAVIEDGSPIDKLPTFRRLLRYRQIVGEPYALAMNVALLQSLAEAFPQECCHPTELGIDFAAWLRQHDINPLGVIAAGKNFAKFDLQFLNRLHGFNEHIQFHPRSLDPAVLYMHSADEYPPNIGLCLHRAGINKTITHRAVDDALDVIKLFRHKGL